MYSVVGAYTEKNTCGAAFKFGNNEGPQWECFPLTGIVIILEAHNCCPTYVAAFTLERNEKKLVFTISQSH